MSWAKYRKQGVTEMRLYEPGEDLSRISVQPDYTPKQGDMVARDPAKPADQWLVNADYFKVNYERLNE